MVKPGNRETLLLAGSVVKPGNTTTSERVVWMHCLGDTTRRISKKSTIQSLPARAPLWGGRGGRGPRVAPTQQPLLGGLRPAGALPASLVVVAAVRGVPTPALPPGDDASRNVRNRGLIIIYREIIFVESGSKNYQVEVFDFELSILPQNWR